MTFFYRLTGKSDACGGNIHEYRKEFLFREVLRTMKVKRQEQIRAFLIEESEFFVLRGKFQMRTRKGVDGKFPLMQRNPLMVVISQRKAFWNKLTARR